MKNRVMLNIISPYLHEKSFNTLRTQEALGYIVSAAGSSYGYVLYTRFVVVGPEHVTEKNPNFCF